MAAAVTPKLSPEPSSDSLATRSATKTPGSIVLTPQTASSSAVTTPVAATRPTEADVEVIHIPSYSRWFTWNAIHECEARFVPEFFDGRSPSKNPRVYKCYRNAIIRRFRENPSRKITFTEVRKTIVGDVGSIRRVFDFLDAWGLINYSSSSKPQAKWDDKEGKAGSASAQGAGGVDFSGATKRVCSICKTPCTISCFASDKHGMTLCARCFVRGNYRVGVTSSDFVRIEISEEAKSDWSEKETLLLLEALMHYGDDWRKVANHVGGGKSVNDCVARFIKLPFGEQFHGPPESMEMDADSGEQNAAMPNKRICLSPLADTSNPIMAQAAFLSTLVGVDVAEVSARAAVKALSSLGDNKPQETDDFEEALHEARSKLEKEEQQLEKAISGLAHQVKETEDKILKFEELDLQMEKKRQQFQQLQNQVFVDQLTLLFHTAPPKPGRETASSSFPEEMHRC